MSNKGTHTVVGAIAGGIVAYRLLSNKVDSGLSNITFGGIVGGAVGGILADIVDPPSSFTHRAEGHSIGINIVVSLIYIFILAPLLAKLFLYFGEKPGGEGWFFWAGFIWGLISGHISHLILDSTTPMGLPK